MYAEGGPESGVELPVGIARLPLGSRSPWFCWTRVIVGYRPSSSLGRCKVELLIDDDTERMDALSDALRGESDELDTWCLRLAPACKRPGEAPNSAPARPLRSRLELDLPMSSLEAGVTIVLTREGVEEVGNAREGCCS